MNSDIKFRLNDSLETAAKLSDGFIIISIIGKEDILFSQNYACPEHGISIGKLTPQMFSFNSPIGACKHCTGLGVLMEIDEIRLLDGYGKQKKIRATSVDRVAGEIYSLHYVKNIEDVKNAIFPLLPDEPFGREELSKALKLKGLKLWSAQKLLTEADLLSCKKQGNKLVFNKC